MKIGAIWIRESKDGKKYMSGIIEYPGVELPIVIFKNEEKKSENSPDYQIIWSQPKKQNAEDQPAAESPINDDNIPF